LEPAVEAQAHHPPEPFAVVREQLGQGLLVPGVGAAQKIVGALESLLMTVPYKVIREPDVAVHSVGERKRQLAQGHQENTKRKGQ